MPSTLHGIHKRPAAGTRVRALLARRPAATGVVVRRPASHITQHWPTFGGLAPNHSFVKADEPLCFEEFTGIEYELRKRQFQATERADRDKFGVPLRYEREQNRRYPTRYNLCLRPTIRRKKKGHYWYTRLLALSLLHCCWDDDGNLIRPYKVRVGTEDQYEVHHLRHWSSCRLKDLAIVSRALHAKLTSGAIKRLAMPQGGQPIQTPEQV
jgi:hypothetical protein